MGGRSNIDLLRRNCKAGTQSLEIGRRSKAGKSFEFQRIGLFQIESFTQHRFEENHVPAPKRCTQIRRYHNRGFALFSLVIILNAELITIGVVKKKNLPRQVVKNVPGRFVLKNQIRVPTASLTEIGEKPGIGNDIAKIQGSLRIGPLCFGGG